MIAAIGESGEGKSAFLNLVFFTNISIIITTIISSIIIRQNTRQVLNSPGERKKFLEESELPELCTTQPRVHEVLDDYILIPDSIKGLQLQIGNIYSLERYC